MSSKEQKWKLKAFLAKKEMLKYQKAYYILICYFDSISDEEQPKVNKKLQKLGL